MNQTQKQRTSDAGWLLQKLALDALAAKLRRMIKSAPEMPGSLS